jgi:RHS repeat-associated protein
MEDASGTTTYEYTPKGQVRKESKTISGVSGNPYVTEYTYDMNGNLKTMTYPSGKVITYNYSNNQVTSVLKDAANLATSITYKPFGGVTGLTYGNGLPGSITYDNQYRITGLTAGTGGSILNLGYTGYDYNGNITAITNNLDSTKNKSFSYDSLDRLATANSTGIWGTLAWTYDGVGNRQTENSNNYTYTTGTNKLTNAPGSTFTYDANGNTETEQRTALLTFTYNQNQRLISAVTGTTTANYVYNGSGQRVKKDVNGAVTIFHYSLSGQIISESTGTGLITAEYVYLNGQPLAKMEGTNTYYYHNDHLATPQKMTDSTGAVKWSADYKPFGEATIDQASTITNNLRFPGQYYDAETGLHYNYFRDYNSAIGRYYQVDPIGLRGGINLYRYVGDNPVNWIDPWGLVNAVRGGEVSRVGWQNPNDHNAGLGWRVTITGEDFYDQYGHMDPNTTPGQGTRVNAGDYIGDYADPTNGHSSGPHVHHERRENNGQIVDPGNDSPIPNGRRTSGYGERDNMHSDPHQGNDWVNPGTNGNPGGGSDGGSEDGRKE